MKYKQLILLLISVFLISGYSNAQVYEKTKRIKKSYKVNSDCNLTIANKYGNIHLIPWKKDSVKFEITVNVKSKKKEKVESTMSYIDFDFTSTQYYIIAKTYLKDYMNTFWVDITKLANAFFGAGNSVEINYVVFIPKNVNLKIENKFGNVYTTDLDGELDLNLSNGDFKAHNIKGDSKLKIEFGNMMINELSNARININYAELELNKAKKLRIDSKSSRLNIEEITELDVSSSRDKYYIKSIKKLSGETSFSYITIYNFYKDIILSTRYGSINLKSIGSKFQNIKINSHYTDFDFYFNQNASYKLNVSYNYKSIINIPPQFKTLIKKDVINQEEGLYNSHGIIGKNKQTTSKVVLDMNAGNLNVVH